MFVEYILGEPEPASYKILECRYIQVEFAVPRNVTGFGLRGIESGPMWGFVYGAYVTYSMDNATYQRIDSGLQYSFPNRGVGRCVRLFHCARNAPCTMSLLTFTMCLLISIVTALSLSFSLTLTHSLSICLSISSMTAGCDQPIQRANFDSPVVARFIRLHPTEWNHWPSLRLTVYGCEASVTHGEFEVLTTTSFGFDLGQ